MGPLVGIKVIEMAGIGPVPMCGMMMSDMGAEVCLVERKSGASAESSLHVSKRDMMKRGKSSIALDLKDPDDIASLLELIDGADVLIEGFRPGVMEKLGLGQGLAELLAIKAVLPRGVPAEFGSTQNAPADAIAGAVEAAERPLEALDARQKRVFTDLDILHHDLAGD